MTRRLLVATALAALAAAAPASAQEVTRAELRDLAERARDDPAALQELREVEQVDGEPVALETALVGAEGRPLERRLETLAESLGDPAAPAPEERPEARGDAEQILSEGRYREEDDGVNPFGWLGGLSLLFWLGLGVAVVVVSLLVALSIARRRSELAVQAHPDGPAAVERRVDLASLEDEAADAERQGDFERALRLLFRAGLLRLHRARAIVLRDSLTTGQVRRELRSREFDGVARVFDEVTYGRRPAERRDVTDSRRRWEAVLEEAGAR